MSRPHHYMLPLIAVLAILLLAGCGKKGPLYLPDSPSAPGHKQPKR